MYSAIDILASEYGWGKKDILNDVYPDEMFYLTEQIRKRRLGNYRTLLAIQHNPYSKNPKELIKSFEPEELRNRSDEFNASSFENFKNSLDSRSAIKVK